MKKILLLLVAFICTVGISAQAVLSLDRTSHNFGTFKESKVQKTTFTATNTGNKPLIIQQAFTSCGCTVANYTKTPIQPGEKGTITVSYDGKNKFPGQFRKVVTVRSNASNSLVRIYVEGILEKD